MCVCVCVRERERETEREREMCHVSKHDTWLTLRLASLERRHDDRSAGRPRSSCFPDSRATWAGVCSADMTLHVFNSRAEQHSLSLHTTSEAFRQNVPEGELLRHFPAPACFIEIQTNPTHQRGDHSKKITSVDSSMFNDLTGSEASPSCRKC